MRPEPSLLPTTARRGYDPTDGCLSSIPNPVTSSRLASGSYTPGVTSALSHKPHGEELTQPIGATFLPAPPPQELLPCSERFRKPCLTGQRLGRNWSRLLISYILKQVYIYTRLYIPSLLLLSVRGELPTFLRPIEEGSLLCSSPCAAAKILRKLF